MKSAELQYVTPVCSVAIIKEKPAQCFLSFDKAHQLGKMSCFDVDDQF